MADIVIKRLTSGSYADRTVTPIALACIHITGNKSTANNPDLHAAALDEWAYANRAGAVADGGPSAHYYVARDGWAIEAINPVRKWAWSNGDLKEPNRDNPGIVDVIQTAKDKGVNLNQMYWLEFENVGHGPSGKPITNKQKQLMAEVIAAHAKRTGLPINRKTVHGHWEINGIDRQTCPNGGDHEAFLKDIIDRARLILNPPAPTPEPEPVPIPEPTSTMYTQAQVDTIVQAAEVAAKTAAEAPLLDELTVLRAKIVTAQNLLTSAKEALS